MGAYGEVIVSQFWKLEYSSQGYLEKLSFSEGSEVSFSLSFTVCVFGASWFVAT